MSDNEWKPMGTAPRDGTELLIRVKLRAGYEGCCLVGHYMPGHEGTEDDPPMDEGWYFWDGRMFDTASYPLEWRHIQGCQSPADAIGKAIPTFEILNHPCCQDHARDWSERRSGLLPASEHAPTCENFKEVHFQSLSILGEGVIATTREITELLIADENASAYEIGNVWMTQDQFDKLENCYSLPPTKEDAQ